MSDDILPDLLPYLTQKCSHLVTEEFHRGMNLQRVSRSRWRMLVWLSEHQPYSIKDLTERLMLKQPTVTRLVDMAIADGLVEKNFDLKDGRQTIITLTTSGEALAKELKDRARLMNKRLVEKIGKRRAKNLATQLHDVIGHLESEL